MKTKIRVCDILYKTIYAVLSFRTLSSRDMDGLALTVISLEVKNAGELRYIMNRLSSVPGVTAVERNGR